MRAPKKPARWEASWTESEKARSFLSSLNGEAKAWPMATLPRLAAREPRMVSPLRAPQWGQSWVVCVDQSPPDFR